MRQAILLLLLFVSVGVAFAGSLPRPTNVVPNTLVICFDADAIGSVRGEINISKTEAGQVQLGLPTFDEIAVKYNIVDIQRRYAKISDPEWKDANGTHPSNVFSITVMYDDKMSMTADDLTKDSEIFWTDDDILALALDELSKDPALIWADYDWLMRQEYIPNDERYSQQWHHPVLNMPEVWDYIQSDEHLQAYDPETDEYKDIVIAIIDSGIKWNHPDLASPNPTLGADTGNMWINYYEANASGMTINWQAGTVAGGNGLDEDDNGYPDDIIGYSFVTTPVNQTGNQSYQSFGTNHHGTHVAGCAAAIGDNGIGVTGTSMKVKLMTLRGAPNNSNSEYIQGGYTGMYYAVETAIEHNLKMVINCSWGSYGGGAGEATAVNYAVQHGAIVVASAGNDPWDMAVGQPPCGANPCTNPNHHHGPHMPSNIPAAIAVTSVQQADGQYSFTWSCYGDNVDIASPGQNILATYWSGSGASAQNTYSTATGTSMSSPVAAGVIATLLSVHGTLNAGDVETRLRETGAPLNHEYYEQGKLGGGRLDAFKLIFYDVLPKITLASNVAITENTGNGDGVVNFGETVDITASLHNDIDWNPATGVTVQLVCDTPGVTITSQNPISIANLGQDATSSPFTFTATLGTNISTREIPFKFVVRSNQEATNPYPYQTEIPFVCNASNSAPGWPVMMTGAMNSAPMVHDFGAGNRLVTIIGNNLYLIDAQGATQTGFPVNVGGTDKKIAIGDVNGDGADEIVVVSSGNTAVVRVINSTGNVLYDRTFTTTTNRSSVVIADLDGNGQNEILFTAQTARHIYMLNGHDLSDFGASPITMEAAMSTNLAVGDLNGDGIKEIVVRTSGAVAAYNPTTGQNLPGFPVTTDIAGDNLGGSSSSNGLTIADIDGLGDFEIINGGSSNSANNPIYIIKSNGSVLRQTTVNGGIRTEIAAVSLAGDGQMQLAFGTGNGNFYLKDRNLNTLPGFPVFVGQNVVINSSPVFADVDGDGVLDIIFGDNAGNLHILKRNGQYISGYPIKISSDIPLAPWVGQFNTVNGFADIVVMVNGGIDFINTQLTQSDTAPYRWNQFRGNAQNTAFNPYPSSNSDDDQTQVVLQKTLWQNYPNPFNPSTTIKFDMDRSEHAVVSIYNIRGQLVTTLLDKDMPSGTHSVVWNGIDESGNAVSSGIYFYRLTTGDFAQTKKMLLMK